MNEFPISMTEIFKGFWRNRRLIFSLVKREVLSRYKGSIGGLAWSFLNPLFMLVIYTLVFSVVFKARWGMQVSESKTDFAIILFVGLIIHSFFSECVIKAPLLIIGNSNFVKKVIFPLEALSWVNFGTALFHASISLFVLLCAQLIFNRHIPWTAIYFPLVLIPLFLMTVGLSWFLSATGVYFRDISQITNMVVMVLLFATPVFYPISNLPTAYQDIIRLNPLAFVIEEGRSVLLYGKPLNFYDWSIMMFVCFLVFWIGFIWFQKTRKGFADVI